MLLGNAERERSEARVLLQKVRTQAERATNIVNNLLNFSRTGGATEFGELNIARVLDDTLQLLEPQVRRSQIEILRSYDKDAPQAYGNAGKLQQVFTNLLLNARDAIPDGGRINRSNQRGPMMVLFWSRSPIRVSASPPEERFQDLRPFYTTKGVGQGHRPRSRRFPTASSRNTRAISASIACPAAAPPSASPCPARAPAPVSRR
jgi:C4-dicarboxylate-specific signal transduction histidine kinase